MAHRVENFREYNLARGTTINAIFRSEPTKLRNPVYRLGLPKRKLKHFESRFKPKSTNLGHLWFK